jgi:hypothetical protein
MKFSDDKTKDTLLKAGGLVALYFIVNKFDSQHKKDIADEDMANNPAASQAAAIKTLLRPYGAMWMRFIVGVNVDEIMRVAGQISNLNEVNDYYKKLIGDDNGSINDDLELCLGPELHQKFLSLATKGKTGSWYYTKESTNVPANYWVITKSDTNVRRTPIMQSRLFLNDNIVKTVPRDKILGASTGKFAYDEANKVLFIEFWTLLKAENKRVTYFVAKSQVELVSNAEKLAREKKQGKINLEIIEGFLGSTGEFSQEVVSTSQAIIYDEKFNKVSLAPANTIIGFPLMTLNTGKGKHIQVKTVQGLLRWVNADQAQIRERKF